MGTSYNTALVLSGQRVKTTDRGLRDLGHSILLHYRYRSVADPSADPDPSSLSS